MILPTSAEADVLRSYARRKFGTAPDRLLLVPLAAPIDAALVVAPFDLRAYCDHVDLRHGRGLMVAQASATVDRILWCSPVNIVPRDTVAIGAAVSVSVPTIDTLESNEKDPDPVRRAALARLVLLRSLWPAVDMHVEAELRKVADCEDAGLARCVELTPGNAPPGLGPVEAAHLLVGRPTVGPGSLWSVTSRGGLALVMVAPAPAVWHAVRNAWSSALSKSAGIVDAVLVAARTLVAWSPEPLDVYLEAHPGFAEMLWKPMREMGGFAAQASASFL